MIQLKNNTVLQSEYKFVHNCVQMFSMIDKQRTKRTLHNCKALFVVIDRSCIRFYRSQTARILSYMASQRVVTYSVRRFPSA